MRAQGHPLDEANQYMAPRIWPTPPRLAIAGRATRPCPVVQASQRSSAKMHRTGDAFAATNLHRTATSQARLVQGASTTASDCRPIWCFCIMASCPALSMHIRNYLLGHKLLRGPMTQSIPQATPATAPLTSTSFATHDRFLRMHQVCEMCGLSRSAIYGRIKLGLFPAQVQLGPKSVAWLASDITTGCGTASQPAITKSFART